MNDNVLQNYHQEILLKDQKLTKARAKAELSLKKVTAFAEVPDPQSFGEECQQYYDIIQTIEAMVKDKICLQQQFDHRKEALARADAEEYARHLKEWQKPFML